MPTVGTSVQCQCEDAAHGDRGCPGSAIIAPTWRNPDGSQGVSRAYVCCAKCAATWLGPDDKVDCASWLD